MRQHPSQYNLRMPARPPHHPIPVSSPMQLHHGSQHGPITPHSQAHSYSSRIATHAPRQHISSPHIIRHTVPHPAQVTSKFLFYHQVLTASWTPDFIPSAANASSECYSSQSLSSWTGSILFSNLLVKILKVDGPVDTDSSDLDSSSDEEAPQAPFAQGFSPSLLKILHFDFQKTLSRWILTMMWRTRMITKFSKQVKFRFQFEILKK